MNKVGILGWYNEGIFWYLAVFEALQDGTIIVQKCMLGFSLLLITCCKKELGAHRSVEQMHVVIFSCI